MDQGKQSHQSAPTTTVVQVQPVAVRAPVVAMAGGNCPVCQVGFLVEEFSILGIILALVFFPLGIICCLFMRERRCTYCGARF